MSVIPFDLIQWVTLSVIKISVCFYVISSNSLKVCVFFFLSVSFCVSIQVCVAVFVSVFTDVSVIVPTCLSIYVFVCVSVSIFVSISMCVFVSACVCDCSVGPMKLSTAMVTFKNYVGWCNGF